MTIHEKLSKIQVEFKANKSRFNSFGKYNFRSAEDILEALKPYNTKYDVYITVNEDYLGNGIIKSTAKIVSNDGANFIEANAIVGVDFNQKGMQVPQQFGSASSYAKKYALGNLLLIDDTQDADATNTHGKTTKTTSNDDDKAWLNKNTPQFKKAKEFISNGGTLATIKKKYKISKEVEQLLTK